MLSCCQLRPRVHGPTDKTCTHKGTWCELLTAMTSHIPPSPGEAHWEVLLRARAIECQAYVVAAAQVGHMWSPFF